MTDREKFLERWAWTGIRARDVQYCEDYEGCAVAVRHNPQSGIGFEDTRSLTPRMAWDRTDDAMVARYGEPREAEFTMTIPVSLLPPEYELNDETLAAVIRADAAMRKWQARAIKKVNCCWTISLSGYIDGFRAKVASADVDCFAPTWPEAVLKADALAEPIWQAREGGAE